MQRRAVGAQFGESTLKGVQVGADLPKLPDFASAALFGHSNLDGILVDIEADESIVLFHVLVSFLGGWCEQPHHAAPVAFRD
jgi:hypothetical protein